jgi:hypothetical protein
VLHIYITVLLVYRVCVCDQYSEYIIALNSMNSSARTASAGECSRDFKNENFPSILSFLFVVIVAAAAAASSAKLASPWFVRVWVRVCEMLAILSPCCHLLGRKDARLHVVGGGLTHLIVRSCSSTFLHHLADILTVGETIVGDHGHDHGRVCKGGLFRRCLIGLDAKSAVVSSVSSSYYQWLAGQGGGGGNGMLGASIVVGHGDIVVGSCCSC